MIIDIVSLFPNMFANVFSTSIIAKAIAKGNLNINLLDLRDFAFNKNRQVDDYPYGGDSGMVIKPEPVFEIADFLKWGNIPVIYFTPQGRLLNHNIVKEYLDKPKIAMICGHYKELDQRVRDEIVTDEISIGDYVLSGGELPAMIFVDALARLQDGVINNISSALNDSFEDGILGCPQYTRPANYLGLKVPEVLLQGNHKEILLWQEEQAIKVTKERRPELLDEE